MWVRSLGHEDPLEEGTVTHSSVLAWEIPWTEELGGLRSVGLQRVGHDGAQYSQLAKDEEKILNAAQRGEDIMYIRTKLEVSSFSEPVKARKQWKDIFKLMKEK